MKSRVGSAPKMQTIYTARVKDGRYSNDSPQKNYYGRTSPGFASSNTNYFYNPEVSPGKGKNESEAFQKNYQDAFEMITNKQDMGIKGQIDVKNSKNGSLQRISSLNKQQTIHGRRLQYPVGSDSNIVKDKRGTQGFKIWRSSSLSQSHFTDNSIKSSLIKSKKEIFDGKFKVAFGYLLDSNEAYLQERRRACLQKARPKDQIFKIHRPNVHTTNKDQYKPKKTIYNQDLQAQNLKTANSFAPGKVCGNSTSKEFHNGKVGSRADLAEWAQGFKLQGPIYGVSTNMNHFPNHGAFDKMVPVATFKEHPMGLPHRTNSTHRSFHKGEFIPATKLATWNNLHPYGNGFDPNRGTTYSHHHSDKERNQIQRWPMHDPELIRSDGKFTTENRSNIINHTQHELNRPNYCQCGRKDHKH